MNAHRLVIIAAAFTIAVAAALATVLVTVSSQAMPRAVRYDLSRAAGTAFVIRGNVNAAQGARYTSLLPGKISAAMEGAPFAFYRASWSDPLGFVAGARPAAPGNTRTVQIVEAATLQAVTAQAALVSGHWPADPVGGGPVPAALPATAASLLHVRTGDMLQLRDRISDRLVRFTVTGLYRPRQVSSPYWGLNDVALSGSTTISGFTTYGPLIVTAAAFSGPLTVNGASWVAAPRAGDIPAGLLRTVAANVSGLRDSLAGAVDLPDLTMTTGLPAVVGGTANNLDVARSLLAICAVLLFLLAAAALLAVARLLAIAGVTRAGADLALILLAVVAGWQLRHYSAVSAGASGTFGVDPVIVAAPALALAGGTVLALRLLPAGGKAGDRLAARGRRLTAAMASWQISRQPIRQGGAALLIVLAVATGTLALSQRQSWTRSVHDQAAFSTGADVRVQTSQPLSAAQAAALARAPGVRQAMPVAPFEQTATNGVTLAVDSGRAADVTLLRPDQSPVPAAGLFGKIRPSGPPPGVILPGRAGPVSFTARLGPAALRLGDAAVTVSIEDADSDVYQVGAGSLPADGRDHTLTASLGSSGGAIYPLRLASISLHYTLPARKAGAPAVFTVDRVSGAAGTAPVPGAALRGWPAVASSAELADVRQFPGTAGPAGPPAVSSSGVAGTGLAVTFSPGYGLTSGGTPGTVPGQLTLTPRAPAVLPGLATQRFLAASNANVGSTVQTFINGTPVSVKIVAAVSNFPTVSGRGGGLIVDLGSVQAMLASGGLEPAPVTQWWLATPGPTPSALGAPSAPGPAPPGLSRLVPPGSAVTSASGTTAALLADPLSTLPQQGLLAVTIAAAVLAITGFCVSIAAGVRQRRAENALLAALGVAPRAAAGQLCLEKLMLSGPAGLTLRGAVVAAGPGVLIGAGLAVAVVPGGGPPAGWPLAGIAILAALAGPAVIAVWQHRRPAPPANPALITTAETRSTGPARRWRRLVAEVTAIAASVAGLVVLHDQGVPAGGSGFGINLYLAIVPVLVAVPVVVVMLRLYPLIIRGLLALSARGTGATGFVALSRAARSTLTGALPAFALVLTLSLATFAGMVSQGIARGEITASWHATGADVMIQTGPGSGPVTPAAVTAIGAVRGVRHATEVWNTSWFTSFGQPISVSAVDPASYAAVVAGTPFPPFPAGRIGAAAPSRVLPPGAVVPVLASPSAAAILGTRPIQLDTLSATGPLMVRVVGTVSETPAQLSGGPFVIMPLLRLPGPAGAPAPNLLLATGSAIDHARLTAVADRVIPGSVTAFRTGVLASLASSPLQHGAGLLITLTIATAAALGLFVVILALALGSAERGITLARLTVMGHERTAGLVMTEAMPAVLTAIAAGVACAIALPLVIGSAIDLSVFTGTSIPVRLQPDALALGLPAVTIGVLALAALAAEARSLRRRDISGVLRAH